MRSDISRAIVDTPTTASVSSVSVDMLMETWISVPFFRRRTVFNCVTGVPAISWSSKRFSSISLSWPTMAMMDWPIISLAVYPKRRSADKFQL